MSTRRFGLMRPGGAARVVALLLVLGMVVSFASTYLVEAGAPVWLVVGAALVVVAGPVIIAARSDRDPKS